MKSVGLGLGLSAVVLASWYGYVNHRRNYWDDRVREMCAKDGGIKVFERVALSDKRYLGADGSIRIPSKLDRMPGYGPLPLEPKSDDLFYKQIETTIIRRDNPNVVRDDVRVFRSSDGKLLGQATYFGRHGGDLISLEVGSRFRCPLGGESKLVNEVFIISAIQGVGK